MQSLPSGASILVKDRRYEKVYRATAILSQRMQWRLFTTALVLIDTLMLAFALRLAFFVRFDLSLSIFWMSGAPAEGFYQRLSLILIPLWLFLFALVGLYQRRNLLGGIKEYDLLFRAVTVGMMLLIVAGFLEPVFIFARGWLLLAWLFAFLAVAMGRFLLRRQIYFLRRHGYFLTPALIVGANEEGSSLAQQLLGWRTSGLYVLGFVDDRMPAGAAVHPPLHVLGGTAQLEALIARYGIEELILAVSALSRDDMVDVFTRYGLRSGLNLRLSSGLYEIITTGLEVKEMGFVPLVCVHKARMTGVDRLLKLALDYCATLLGLLLVAPFLLLIALAIRLDSPGPIIYRRRVMGLHGRQFDAFKFRTMYIDGDRLLADFPELREELAREHKLKEDPRVTRVGHVLRRFSLDELPQLFNVLRREMSLVGPRMISPPEMEKYGQLGMNLLTVLPGLTGLWQVSGRSDVSYEERVRLDMHYIRNWTIWLDLQLLLQTIPAVLKKRGAY